MKENSHKIVHFRPLFFGFVALLFAIMTTKFVFSGVLSYILVVAIALVGIVVFLLIRKNFIPLIVLLLFFAFGVGWYFVGISTFEGEVYTSQCEVIGRVTDYKKGSGIILDDVKINGHKSKNIYLSITSSDNGISVGDVISFSTYINKTKLFELGQFNSFYYRNGIGYEAEINKNQISIVGSKVKLDEKIRLKAKSLLLNAMGEINGNVAFAVLFGDKSGIDNETKSTYDTAGIVHLLSVSGLHVGFLIALLGFFLKKCKVKGFVNFFICFVFIFAYSFLCGFSPSVLRAGAMGMVLLCAALTGKRYDSLSCLGFAGIIILFCSPLSALDVGFLMSFSCVFAILTISPTIEKGLSKMLPRKISQAIAISCSAEIGVFPFLSQIFSTFNFLSFFVNLIVIPIFSILYPMLFLGMIFCLCVPIFSFVLKICSFGFDCIYLIAQIFSKTNLIINLSPVSTFVTSAVFVLLFVVSRYFMVSQKLRIITASLVLVSTGILCGVELLPQNLQSSINCCYKYGYDCILVTNSSKESVIIDLMDKDDTANFLKCCGVRNVSAVFVLNRSKLKYETFSYLNNPTIIRCGTSQTYEEEVLFEKEEIGKVGGFEFVYFANDSVMLGLQISFDNTKLFISKNREFTESDLQMLKEKDFDFAIIGSGDYAKCFSQNTVVIADFEDEGVSASLESDGNLTFKLDGKNYKRRCLD